jgi:GMP synthase (glutamine-hydrolysing)
MMVVVNFGSNKTPYFSEIIKSFGVPVVEVKDQDFEESLLIDAKGIILSGAPILLSEIDYSSYIKKYQFLRDLTIPVLGVCFGHQLLGLLHGATCIKMKAEDRDWRKITLIEKSSLFSGINDGVKFKQDHCEEINLPHGFKLLAKSTHCENEAMEHIILPHYAVQFHPEVSEEYGRQLLKNFVDTCMIRPLQNYLIVHLYSQIMENCFVIEFFKSSQPKGCSGVKKFSSLALSS